MSKPPDSNSKSLWFAQQNYRFTQKIAGALIQWLPLGSSGGLLINFLSKQEWGQAILMFPVTAVTAVWAAYSKHFVARLQEIYGERGRQDADLFVKWLDNLDKVLRWQLSSTIKKYMIMSGKCLSRLHSRRLSYRWHIYPHVRGSFRAIRVKQ